MASSSSKEQLVTVQMNALNTVCLQFADADKKCLKRKVTELQHSIRYDKKWSRKMKIKIEVESTTEISEVQEVLEKGKETGITLSAEEVRKMCKHLECCHEIMFCALDEDDW